VAWLERTNEMAARIPVLRHSGAAISQYEVHFEQSAIERAVRCVRGLLPSDEISGVMEICDKFLPHIEQFFFFILIAFDLSWFGSTNLHSVSHPNLLVVERRIPPVDSVDGESGQGPE
jgi:hypothetical protein